MTVYSKYVKVVDTDGHAMTVKDVLKEINKLLDSGVTELDE